MNHRKIFLSALLLLFLVTSSCKKEVVSEFILQEHEYSAGEFIKYENLSENSKGYKWELLDPSGKLMVSSAVKNPDLQIPIGGSDGQWTIRLTSWKNTDKSIKQSSRSFKVKTFRYSYHIHFDDYDAFRAYADDEYLGECKPYMDGEFHGTLPSGNYIIRIDYDGTSESQLVSILSTSNNNIYF